MSEIILIGNYWVLDEYFNFIKAMLSTFGKWQPSKRNQNSINTLCPINIVEVLTPKMSALDQGPML